ncbi:M20 family metallopeptidase [Planctomicrobium sp. SH664]|uniref:M20 family metallopeptidase n=1 Tax=Planctomicrobium sp. SH664 TaxID=3448125 RepID=UPI003F5C0C5C
MLDPVQLASELIEFDSVSSRSNLPVSERLESWLRELNFETERVEYVDPNGVSKVNLVSKLGSGLGGMAYSGHSDVVPAPHWSIQEHGPFQPTVRDGRLYGRGSTDMKGSLACMLSAVSAVVKQRLRAPFYFCCSADEEIGAIGAEIIARSSKLYREMVEGQTRMIVGEPTQCEVIHAHKGGCVLQVTARGKAMHSSFGSQTNANWRMIPFLHDMQEFYQELETAPQWRDDRFQPSTTCMNIGVNDHNPGRNITSVKSVCTIHLRAMPGIDFDSLLARIRSIAEKHGLEYEQIFRVPTLLCDANSQFVQECVKFSSKPAPSTLAGGTDAGRFGELKQCIVMGPGDIAQAHTGDESISLQELQQGVETYGKMLQHWCC